MRRICTIETGRGSAELTERFGDYPAMTEAYLRPHLGAAEFSVVRAMEGERLPDVGEFDGYVILGSKHSVYEDLPWIEPLKQFVREAAEARIPMVGLCFGHQIMAEALGGRVRKADAGWVVGPAEYAVVGAGTTVRSMALHQDQVVVQPPASELVLRNDACAVAGLLYSDFPALSVQPHPEFDHAFIRDLLLYLRGNPIAPDLVDEALACFDHPIDQERFFRAFALVLTEDCDRHAVAAALAGTTAGSTE